MVFTFWTLIAPLLLGAAGFGLAIATTAENPIAGGMMGVAFIWLLLTGRARKTYWSSRIRARATHDARRARSRRA